ncbi:hypothetical protein IMSAGC022_01537 [Alistipes sp.]|nr:hypothetical protein IMSAGC022_01537 [Alistipes sp.]
MNPRTTTSGTTTAPVPVCNRTAMPPAANLPNMRLHARGRYGPIAIGELLKPLQRIACDPDRNRLLAELFQED